jgi:hypothetical protein
MEEDRTSGPRQQPYLLDQIASVPMLALPSSSLERHRWPATRQRHKLSSGLRFRPPLVNFEPGKLAEEVATHQGRHRQLGLLLLLHLWTSNSPNLGMNYCVKYAMELLVKFAFLLILVP